MPVESHDPDATPETAVASVVAKRGPGRPKKAQAPANSAPVNDTGADESAAQPAGRRGLTLEEKVDKLRDDVDLIVEGLGELSDNIDSMSKAVALLAQGGDDDLRARLREQSLQTGAIANGIRDFISVFSGFSRLFAFGGAVSHARFRAFLQELERVGDRMLAEQAENRRAGNGETPWWWNAGKLAASAGIGAAAVWLWSQW